MWAAQAARQQHPRSGWQHSACTVTHIAGSIKCHVCKSTGREFENVGGEDMLGHKELFLLTEKHQSWSGGRGSEDMWARCVIIRGKGGMGQGKQTWDWLV